MQADILATAQPLMQIINKLPTVIFVWRQGAGLDYINQATEAVLGYKASELQTLVAQSNDRLMHTLIHAVDHSIVKDAVASLSQAPVGSSQTFTIRCHHKNGKSVWLDVTLSSEAKRAQQITALAGVAHDVTDQRILMDRLKFQAALIPQMDLPLFTTNLQGQITFWNQGAETLFKLQSKATWGQPLRKILHISAQQENEWLDDLLKNSQLSRELPLVSPSEETMWLKLASQTITAGSGEVIGFMFSPTNITDRKLTESKLERTSRELEALHKFSVPLNEIKNLNNWGNAIVTQLTRDLDYDVVTLYLWQENQGYFYPEALSWKNLNMAETASMLSLRQENQFTLQQMPDGVLENLPEPWTAHYPAHFQKRQAEIKSVLFTPLSIESKTIGLISLESAEPNYFTPTEKRLISTIARVIAIVINNVQLLTREKEEHKVSDTLREISAVLVSSLQLDQTLRIILESLERLLRFDSAAIFLLTPANRLRMVSVRGMEPQEVTIASSQEFDRFPLDEAVVSSKKPLAVADIRSDERWTTLKGGENIRSWLGVPLLFRNNPLGLVTIDRWEIDPFTPEQISLAEAFAGHAAIALQNAELFSQIQSQQSLLRKLSNRVVAAQEEERRRISRELHDEMGQALTAIKLNLQMLLTAPPSKEEVLIERLEELVTLSNSSLQEVRRLAMDLRPTLLDDLGLVPTLHWYQNQFMKRSNAQLSLSVVPDLPRLSPETETALYRVVQEALTNVSRHAEANNVEISLSMDNQAIRFSIIDDGKGFVLSNNNQVESMGVGLTSMLERVEALNGQIDVSSSLGEGTCILISIPKSVALGSS